MKRAIFLVACLASVVIAVAAQEPAPVYQIGNGVLAPQVLKEVKPSYPPDAMQAGIVGTVRLGCVVLTDGTVGDIRVLEGVDPRLQAEAIEALQQWQFKPGSKDGQPVQVRVEVEIAFTTARGPRLNSPDVVKAGPGVILPKLVHETRPTYTTWGRSAGITGSVAMDCVVLTDGTVGDIKVTRRLDPGLDAEAIRTVRQWRFTPGEKDGRAVPVQVMVEMSFSLR